MSLAAPISLQPLLDARTLWHAGRSAQARVDALPTHHTRLDELLPTGGWPRGALSELLLPQDGVGEVSLLLPSLAQVAKQGGRIVLVAPPYIPYAPAWQAAGLDLCGMTLVDAEPRDALWAMEQCLRSGSCDVVLGWPQTGDAQALRRLQVAAQSGGGVGLVVRDARHASNPSPAALRIEWTHGTWRVRKCRGAAVPAQAFVLQ